MLNSLHIRNYRNLKDFKIQALDQINLIAGKNNTGKSSLLEAISMYVAKGDVMHIRRLLERRGENFINTANRKPAEVNIKAFSSLFTDRITGFNTTNSIIIGEIHAGNPVNKKFASFRFVRYIDEMMSDNQGHRSNRRYLIESDPEINAEECKYGFEIRVKDELVVYPLEYLIGNYGLNRKEKPENFQYVFSDNVNNNDNGKLFDNITLTEKEPYVVEALKVIEPSVERIAFVGNNGQERSAVIKLSGNSQILPLQSMGDGINRILSIILAMVNASDGYLLIDEFENGLHHTVQRQLWKVIFKLAEQLNIQIFATTHSNDCISGFEEALNDPDNTITGKLIRLENTKGIIKEVEYSPEELKIANDRNIETR